MKGMGSSITLIVGFTIFVLLVIVVGILGSSVNYGVNLNTELSQDRDIFKSRSAASAILSNKSLIKDLEKCTTECSSSKISRIKENIGKNLNMYKDYRFELENQEIGEEIISKTGGNGNGHSATFYLASPSRELHAVNVEAGGEYR